MRLESISTSSSKERENEIDELTYHNACAKGNLSVVKVYLAQQEFDINTRDDTGCPGFHEACHHGRLNVVQFLLQQEFDMNISDEDGFTGFHEACHNGILNVVQFLLEQEFDRNISDNEGTTGFHFACSHGKLNLVKFLLQEGFDMNVGRNDGSTGFHDACSYGQLNMVKFLLQQEFDMNIGDENGYTRCHTACYHGKLNVVQFLLEQGFKDINKVARGGKTGLEMLFDEELHLSEDERFIPCILFLIQSGAQLNENYLSEELTFAIKNRIIEITVVKKTIFENWTGSIAQAIADFTMGTITSTSSQNLAQFLDLHTVQTTHGWCSFL